ncbi:MAG: dihydrodipicolinate synthase family protein [Sphingomonadales bacterium]|nr:dihydrodipicolinate synthase family protein [Sphingomonadales bacterium]
MKYTPTEAKMWAAEHWRGVCNVIMPSFTEDLSSLNEEAIRFDVRRNIEHGFWGALLVSECATTADEYRRFMEICVEEAGDKQTFLMHGTFDTRQQTIEMAQEAERIGMGGVLIGHPNSFYPETEDELYEHIESIAGSTNLCTSLFVTVQMNLTRLHASGYPPAVIRRAAEIPNVVAVKYEVGRPGIAGDLEVYKLLKDTGVLFSDPLEAHSPLTVEYFGQQWMGTSNYEFWGGAVPEYFDLLQKREYERAMEIYWRIQPARVARVAIQSTVVGANFIHRALWKYQQWLQGYNGGRMRQPAAKLNDAQMRQMRDALIKSGFDVKDEGPQDFYRGRVK